MALSVLALALVTYAAPSLAAERVDSQSMTAPQVKQLIKDQGSVILSTGQYNFDRYVANDSHCYIGEKAEAAFVPTANSSSSFVGYTCKLDLSDA
ncbi:hypothetical protein [Cohaesibacter sp. ES.047]|uniref:hypothetical protein n=1 Tax=Cohaesibacter sp. ES.047 TaxID=1798205 RepID=UPI000BB99CEB|nr:hypothetical protein [Cohaesibacter sp. ES.047]